MHPYTLQRTQCQSLSAATSQLATDTLSLLWVAWKSVNPDGEHISNAWQGIVSREDCLTLASTAQLSWESNPLHTVDEQGRREGQQAEPYAPLSGMNILWSIARFSEGYGTPDRHTFPRAEMLELTLDALRRISSHTDDGGQRRKETEPPTLRLRMLTQVIQEGIAFQMRNSGDPERRHLRWSLLQRSTFEGLIRLHVHPESDESISEQNITNCVLLKGLLVMLCAQDDSFRSLRGEDASGGSVRDLVLNHFMYALHLHEGIEEDEHFTILKVGAVADAEFDLVTYWTHPNPSAVPMPRLGSVMATIEGPRGGGYDENLLVFLLRMMEICHRNNVGNFSGVITCLEWIFALTPRTIPQTQFLEAGGIQRVMDIMLSRLQDSEVQFYGSGILARIGLRDPEAVMGRGGVRVLWAYEHIFRGHQEIFPPGHQEDLELRQSHHQTATELLNLITSSATTLPNLDVTRVTGVAYLLLEARLCSPEGSANILVTLANICAWPSIIDGSRHQDWDLTTPEGHVNKKGWLRHWEAPTSVKCLYEMELGATGIEKLLNKLSHLPRGPAPQLGQERRRQALRIGCISLLDKLTPPGFRMDLSDMVMGVRLSPKWTHLASGVSTPLLLKLATVLIVLSYREPITGKHAQQHVLVEVLEQGSIVDLIRMTMLTHPMAGSEAFYSKITVQNSHSGPEAKCKKKAPGNRHRHSLDPMIGYLEMQQEGTKGDMPHPFTPFILLTLPDLKRGHAGLFSDSLWSWPQVSGVGASTIDRIPGQFDLWARQPKLAHLISHGLRAIGPIDMGGMEQDGQEGESISGRGRTKRVLVTVVDDKTDPLLQQIWSIASGGTASALGAGVTSAGSKRLLGDPDSKSVSFWVHTHDSTQLQVLLEKILEKWATAQGTRQPWCQAIVMVPYGRDGQAQNKRIPLSASVGEALQHSRSNIILTNISRAVSDVRRGIAEPGRKKEALARWHSETRSSGPAGIAYDARMASPGGRHFRIQNFQGEKVLGRQGQPVGISRIHFFYQNQDAAEFILLGGRWMSRHQQIAWSHTGEQYHKWHRADQRSRTGMAPGPVKASNGEGVYGLELEEEWQFELADRLFGAAVGINFIPKNLRDTAGFIDSQLQVALTDLGMEREKVIYWGPEATVRRPDGSLGLDFDRILIPERIQTQWHQREHHSVRAQEFLLRRQLAGSQPYQQGSDHWTWRTELRDWTHSTGREPPMIDRWDDKPPLIGYAQAPSILAVDPFISLYVIWRKGLYGPLRARPWVKVGSVRGYLSRLLVTDISGYSLNTVLGPMGPDKPLRNFIWESSKLLSLVQNSQRPRHKAYGRSLGTIFIRQPPGPGERTTRVVEFYAGQTGRNILTRIRPGAEDDWYLLYGRTVLDLDATLPHWLRDTTLDLMGRLRAGNPENAGEAGGADDTPMEEEGADLGGPGVRGPQGGPAVDEDEESPDEEEDAGDDQDGPSDLDRSRARDWCIELLSIGQLDTNAKCIAMLSELFNLTERKASTLISEHLYGSATRAPSLISRLKALAKRFEQEWQKFLDESRTIQPNTGAMWSELSRELAALMELTIGAASRMPSFAKSARFDRCSSGIPRPVNPSWSQNPGLTHSETLVFTNLTLATVGPLTRALDRMNIAPGMRGTWNTACTFSPDTAARGESGTGAAKVTIQRTQGAADKARAVYLGLITLEIPGQETPTLRIFRDNLSNHGPKISLEPANEVAKRQFAFMVALISLYRSESEILGAASFLLRRDAGWVTLAELYTSGTGRNLAGLMHKTGFQRSGQLVAGISCQQPNMAIHTQRILEEYEGTIIELKFLNCAPKDHQIEDSSKRFLGSLNCPFRVSRLAAITARTAASVAAVVLRTNHNTISNNLFSGVAEGSQGNVTAVELLLEGRFRSLIRYCASQSMAPEQLEILLQSLGVEVTAPRNEITERSNIILLFNDQSHFSLAQIRFFALHVATMCAIRSDRPEHAILAWCPVMAFDPMTPPGQETNRSQYCSIASVSARGEGGLTERIFLHLTDNKPGSRGQGTLSTEDVDRDLVAKNLIGALLRKDPSRLLSFEGATAMCTLRLTDRSPKPSGKAVTVLANSTTHAREGETLTHPGGRDYVANHGTTGQDEGPRFERSPLWYLQTDLRTGFKNKLTSEVAEIGVTLAGLISNALPDLIATDKDANITARCRDQVAINIQDQLLEWARGATFPAQSMSGLAPDDSLPLLPPTPPNMAHRLLVGALAFFTNLPTTTPLPMVAPVFCGILYQIINKQNDPSSRDKPHRVTLHLSAKFLSLVHRAMVPERVPGQVSEHWVMIDSLEQLRNDTAVAYRCILCSNRVEDLEQFTDEGGTTPYRCTDCAQRGQTQAGQAVEVPEERVSTDVAMEEGNNQACVDGQTEFLLYSAHPPYQVVRANAVIRGTILVGTQGQPVSVTAVTTSPSPSLLLRLGPALHISANHPVNSGKGWGPAGRHIMKGCLKLLQCDSTWNFTTKDSKPLLSSDGKHLIAPIGHRSWRHDVGPLGLCHTTQGRQQALWLNAFLGSDDAKWALELASTSNRGGRGRVQLSTRQIYIDPSSGKGRWLFQSPEGSLVGSLVDTNTIVHREEPGIARAEHPAVLGNTSHVTGEGQDGLGRAILRIPEDGDGANAPVVVELAAEEEIPLLQPSADADKTALVPPAVVGNAVSPAVAGQGGSRHTTQVELEVDGEELPDPAGTDMLLGSGGDVTRNPEGRNDGNTSALRPATIADDDRRRLKAGVNGSGRAVLVILGEDDEVTKGDEPLLNVGRDGRVSPEVLEDAAMNSLGVAAASVSIDKDVRLEDAAMNSLEVAAASVNIDKDERLEDAAMNSLEDKDVRLEDAAMNSLEVAAASVSIDKDERLEDAAMNSLEVAAASVSIDRDERLEDAAMNSLEVAAASVSIDRDERLGAAADADVEAPVSLAALGHDVFAIESLGGQESTTPAVSDSDEDQLLDADRAEIRLVPDIAGVAVRAEPEEGTADGANASETVAPTAYVDQPQFEAASEANGVVLMPPALLDGAGYATAKVPRTDDTPGSRVAAGESRAASTAQGIDGDRQRGHSSAGGPACLAHNTQLWGEHSTVKIQHAMGGRLRGDQGQWHDVLRLHYFHQNVLLDDVAGDRPLGDLVRIENQWMTGNHLTREDHVTDPLATTDSQWARADSLDSLGQTRGPWKRSHGAGVYNIELADGNEFMLANGSMSAALGNACVTSPGRLWTFGPQLAQALRDLQMSAEMRITWAPGAAVCGMAGEIRLDLDCILVPERIWAAWPPSTQRSHRANDYMRRLYTTSTNPFLHFTNNWTWKNELESWMGTGGPLQLVEGWEQVPPLARRGPTASVAPYLTLYVIWDGKLHGPLRAHPSVKIRRMRKVLATLLGVNPSLHSLDTISGPMDAGRPLGDYIWTASKLLLLVRNSQSIIVPPFVRQWGPEAQACVALNTKIRLANGDYCPVQALPGKTVATTDGGSAVVVRVHRFYPSDNSHRLVKIQGNWITENHFILHPTKTSSKRMPPAGQHESRRDRWIQADGRQWWQDGGMRRTEPESKSSPPTWEDSRSLNGEAVFNVELDRAAGAFLLNGLAVATLGNGVFLCESFPTYHDSLFQDLSRQLAKLQMQDQRVINWGPGACTAKDGGVLGLDYSRLLIPVTSMAGWLRQSQLSKFQRSFIEGTSHQLLQEQVAQGTPNPRSLVLVRQTWVEEMHIWLQTNAYASSQIRTQERHGLMSSKPLKGFDGHGPDRTPCCLAITLQGVFLGRFLAEYNIRITDLVRQVSQKIRSGYNKESWWRDSPDEILRRAHEEFLESTLKAGLEVSTIHGLLPLSSRLSDHVWEDSKLLIMNPVGQRETSKWWEDPCKEASPVNGLTPGRLWKTPGPIAAGMVVLVHSLETAKHHNGRVALVLSGISETGRFAIRLRDFGAFNGNMVQVKPSKMSFLWWGHMPADWPTRHLHRSRALVPWKGPVEYQAGDKVVVQSILTEMRGIQVNGRQATLGVPVTNQLLGVGCWEAAMDDGGTKVGWSSAANLLLSAHQIVPVGLLSEGQRRELERPILAPATWTATDNEAERQQNFDRGHEAGGLPLQDPGPHQESSRTVATGQPTQPPSPSGGGGYLW